MYLYLLMIAHLDSGQIILTKKQLSYVEYSIENYNNYKLKYAACIKLANEKEKMMNHLLDSINATKVEVKCIQLPK